MTSQPLSLKMIFLSGALSIGAAGPAISQDFNFPETLDNGSKRLEVRGAFGPSYSYYHCDDLQGGKKLTVEFLARLDTSFHAMEGENIYAMNERDRNNTITLSEQRFPVSRQTGQRRFVLQQLAEYDALGDVAVARDELTQQNVPTERWAHLGEQELINYARKYAFAGKLQNVHKVTAQDYREMIASCS